MTTQPDPKPEQLWRDLDKDEVPQEGDRFWSTLTNQWFVPASLDLWANTNHVVMWQRPVTPGQCDCAGLRPDVRIMELANRLCAPGPKCAQLSASEVMEITDWIFELDERPHTCVGKSAEEEMKAEVNRWKNERNNAWSDVSKNEREIARLTNDLTEARRKLADLEGWKREQMQVAADTHYHEIAKEIGVPLGHNIASAILPAIKELKRKLENAEKNFADLRRLRKLEQDQVQSPTWRSYATPPTEQDGVKLAMYKEPMVLCLDEEQCIRLRSWTFMPYETAWKWTPITLPKLPLEPEQDADEAAFEKAYKEARIKMGDKPFFKTDFREGWQAALDFARNQTEKKDKI